MRDALLGIIAGLYIPGLAAALYFRVPGPVVAYLAVIGLILFGGLLLEHGRYQTGARDEAATWASTGERFRDPASGRLTEVRSDPKTGKREYIEVQEAEPPHDERP